MRGFTLLAILLVALGAAEPAGAAAPKIKKVLPHCLDLQGRHTIYPSLYERDSYQAYLRDNPGKQSGLRIDVHWRPGPYTNLTLRVELRGSNQRQPTEALLSRTLPARNPWSRWTSLTFLGEPYRRFGTLSAWRATLWDGQLLVAEQRSFLW